MGRPLDPNPGLRWYFHGSGEGPEKVGPPCLDHGGHGLDLGDLRSPATEPISLSLSLSLSLF